MRILVTGSRDLAEDENMSYFVRSLIATVIGNRGVSPHQVTVVHGGARGADKICAQEAEKLGCLVEEHPAQWDEHGRSAGPIRNKKMVDAGADVVLAFPLGTSSGTRGCMALAKDAGIPVINATENAVILSPPKS